MTRRTARPTLRVIREDLDDGWENPYPKSAVESGDPESALPLTELNHPILRKASECFGEDPQRDTPVGTISSAKSECLYEIKVAQWRAAVWLDHDSVCWVVAAGLAKGGHNDRDDFYKRIDRLESRSALSDLRPTGEDTALWKLERAHALIAAWHLNNQETIAEALADVADGGSKRFAIEAPESAAQKGRDAVLAEVDIAVERYEEDDYHADEVVLEIHVRGNWRGSSLATAFIFSLLASVHPPESDWDFAGEVYSNILTIGTISERVSVLRALTASGRRALPEMVSEAHYVHERDLTSRVVEGEATRALCGIYFVPRQNHEELPTCALCAASYAEAQ